MYAMADTSFASWLEEQLREQGISQAELARRAGVTRGAINNILQGERGPGVELAKGIARALKIPEDDVMVAAGLMTPKPNEDKGQKELDYLYHTLREQSSKEQALEFLRYLAEQEEKSGRRKKP